MTKASNAKLSVSCRAGACAGHESLAERPAQAPALQGKDRSALGLWLWVGGAFLLLAIGWAVLFAVARSAKIQSVPLTTSGGETR